MEFTKREYQQFYHGISMSLLSKKSAQKWRYDDETAEEISFLEGLESKVLDKIRQADTPQTETQTKTQNSNLTFKTLEYCDICDHKGCEECVANALDEHCMPSQFKKQIEDECAKEYEELGLKELKELIEADRKDEQTEREDK